MRLRLLAGLAVGVICLGVAAGSAVAKRPIKAGSGAPSRYYLALGDSLAAGYQPSPTTGAGTITKQGYVNDLYRYERKAIPGLKLVNLGCPGDTTTSLLTGRGNAAAAAQFRCDRSGGSQLKAAVAFLRAHHARGEVPLVTIDIGANDVDGCVSASDIGSCVTTGVSAIKANTPKILKALRAAAPAGARFAAMTLYDPVLDEYLQPASDPLQPFGLASVTLLHQVNTAIQHADNAAGFRTADVAGAFDSYDTTDMSTWNGVPVPKDVAVVCTWTWACAPPPAGPNIHANARGYSVIGRSFEKVIGRLKA